MLLHLFFYSFFVYVPFFVCVCVFSISFPFSFLLFFFFSLWQRRRRKERGRGEKKDKDTKDTKDNKRQQKTQKKGGQKREKIQDLLSIRPTKNKSCRTKEEPQQIVVQDYSHAYSTPFRDLSRMQRIYVPPIWNFDLTWNGKVTWLLWPWPRPTSDFMIQGYMSHARRHSHSLLVFICW